MLAGFGLTTFYRRSAERGFDERLSVYIKELDRRPRRAA